MTPEALDLVRRTLKAERAHRDLALLEVAVSTMLRGSDVLGLAVSHVRAPDRRIRERLTIRQKKTDRGLVVHIGERARAAIEQLIEAEGKTATDYLFTRAGDPHGAPLTTKTLRLLVKRWAEIARLDPDAFSSHSLRRTKAAEIYRRTGNLEAVRQLLGHSNIGMTQRYLGVEQEDALRLAEQHEI